MCLPLPLLLQGLIRTQSAPDDMSDCELGPSERIPVGNIRQRSGSSESLEKCMKMTECEQESWKTFFVSLSVKRLWCEKCNFLGDV